MGKKLTTDDFLLRAKSIHGDKYDYGKSEYKGMHDNILIICRVHGGFYQTPQSHIRQKAGCLKCSYEHGVRHEERIKKIKDKYQKIEINRQKKEAYISLKSGEKCIIDLCNLTKVNNYYWQYDGKYCFSRIPEIGRVRMHRFLLGLKKEDKHLVVDHINLNGLDNRMSNIRVCGRHENSMNRPSTKGSSIYKGVSYIKSRKKFKSEIRYKSKVMHLGMFNSEIEAAKAYDEAAKKYFKEFAYLNFKDNEK